MDTRSLSFPLSMAGVALLSLLLQSGCAHAMERKEVTFASVKEQARSLANEDYEAPAAYLPDVFRDMNYDVYRNIRFRPDQALWKNDDLPFQLQFFHRGYLFEDPVRLYEFTETHVQELPYVRDFFRFDDMEVSQFPRRSSGYAGWRLHAPLNSTLYYDEVIAFLGASYFRAVGKGQRYGLSARGILVPDAGRNKEEFPAFTEFWIRKPGPEEKSLEVYSLMQGPSLTGAYAFTITPGAPTTVDVTAHLYPRREIRELGLGALTSMFYFGENTYPKPDDFRPEVHDSDGLAIEYVDGSHAWRPLDIGPVERESRFPGNDVRAFGLYQRDRDFSNYLDSESRYHLRPSARVSLKNGFESGTLLLRELPPDKEFFDNIVLAYLPGQVWNPGDEYVFSYTIEWGDFAPPAELARVLQTRHGRDISNPEEEVFLVEFSLPETFSKDTLRAGISVSETGRIVRDVLEVRSGLDRIQLILHVVPASGGPIQLEAVLMEGTKPLSETWMYRWNPYN